MLIAVDSRPEDLVEPGLRWWSDERFAVGWKGHLFLPGERAGAASVARLAGLLPAAACRQQPGAARSAAPTIRGT